MMVCAIASHSFQSWFAVTANALVFKDGFQSVQLDFFLPK
jgi:hypothetical protein